MCDILYFVHLILGVKTMTRLQETYLWSRDCRGLKFMNDIGSGRYSLLKGNTLIGQSCHLCLVDEKRWSVMD